MSTEFNILKQRLGDLYELSHVQVRMRRARPLGRIAGSAVAAPALAAGIAALFGLPEATAADGTRVTATAARPERNGDCAGVSSTIGPDGGVRVLGIGNSARDAVTDRAGNRLDVGGVDQDRLEWAEDAYPTAVENRAAAVENRGRRRTDQGRVHGVGRTLRLVSNFRPTAAPGAAGGGTKVPVTITTCAGTPGPLTTRTYGAHGSIANDATGRCLYAPGGNGTGHRGNCAAAPAGPISGGPGPPRA